MAKVYSAPEAIKQPSLDFSNMGNYRKESEEYIENLKKFLQKRSKGKNVGEIIKFPAADGYARYMVASMRPLELVHIPLDDAYSFQYAHRLTAKDVQEEIDREKAFEKIWTDAKREQSKNK